MSVSSYAWRLELEPEERQRPPWNGARRNRASADGAFAQIERLRVRVGMDQQRAEPARSCDVPRGAQQRPAHAEAHRRRLHVQVLEGPLRWSAADGEDAEQRASVALGDGRTKSLQLLWAQRQFLAAEGEELLPVTPVRFRAQDQPGQRGGFVGACGTDADHEPF